MALSEEEKNIIKSRDRFKGYQLPKIQLDETGSTYYDVSPHPYFYNQPRFWQQAVFEGRPYGGSGPSNIDIPTTADTPPVINLSENLSDSTSERGLSEEQPKSVTPEPDHPPKKKNSSLYNFLPPTE